MWMHLRSFGLALSGIIVIMMTFPLAFFVYYYIFQVHYFDILSVFAVFIVLGIGMFTFIFGLLFMFSAVCLCL